MKFKMLLSLYLLHYIRYTCPLYGRRHPYRRHRPCRRHRRRRRRRYRRRYRRRHHSLFTNRMDCLIFILLSALCCHHQPINMFFRFFHLQYTIIM